MHTSPITAALARLLLGGAALFTAQTAAGDSPVSTNLLTNGNFTSSLAGWEEESHSQFTSNWDSDSATADGTGSAQGEGLDDDAPLTNPIIWQCVSVVPGARYRLSAAMRLGDGHEVDNSGLEGGFVTVTDAVPGMPCESGAQTLARVDNDGSGFWVRATDEFVVPAGVDRVRVTARVYRAAASSFACCDQDNVLLFDEIALVQLRADVRIQYDPAPPASVRQTVPLPIDLRLTNLSDHAAQTTEVRVFHAGGLVLESDTCTGTVQDVTDGSARYFRVPLDHLASNTQLACRINARARAGFSGTIFLRATAYSSNESDLANNDVVHNLQVVADPEIAVTFDTTPFPPPNSVVQAVIGLRNNGTATGQPAVSFRWTDPSGATVELAGYTTSCAELVYAGGDAFGAIALAPGATRTCTLGFTWPADQRTDLVGRASATLAADYDSSNNAATDTSKLVTLFVNTTADGIDHNPGDGVCAQIQGQFPVICTLRGALMEANAIPGTQTIELQATFDDTPYVLTRSSSDGANFGDLRITDRVRLAGESTAGGRRPRLQLMFPTAEPARAFRITPSSSAYVLIENLEIVGQNLAYNGDGGLIEHASGKLELRNVSLTGGRSLGEGGAIHSADELELVRVHVSGNRAPSGAGLAFDPAALEFLTILDSRFTTNGDGNTLVGGGLWTRRGLVAIDSSTFDANRADRGGAIALDAANFGALIYNSTLDGNDADLEGGAIWAGSSVGINTSTVSGNAAARGNNSAGLGGGVFVDAGVSATTYGSIFAGNTAQLRTSSNGGITLSFPHAAACHGTLSSGGYNSVQPVSTDQLCSIAPTTGDSFDTFPNLAALADNGGPTPTRSLVTTGQEVDRGHPQCLTRPGGSTLDADQRGEARPRDGDGDGSAACDKGAFERADSARVTVAKTGTGDGFIVSSPASIFCGATCSAAFPANASVMLSVQSVTSGSRFIGWSGACSGTSTCTVVASGVTAVTAQFEQFSTRALDVTLVGTGTGSVTSSPAGIACPGDCAQEYDLGTVVTLTASASAGHAFEGWSGAGCSGTGTCVVTMSALRQVSANFSQPLVRVAVAVGGDGSGSVAGADGDVACPTDCLADRPPGTAIQLLATAASGSSFDRWQGGPCDGLRLPGCNFTLTTGLTVTALFKSTAPPTLELLVEGTGRIVSSPAGIDCGSTCIATFTRDSTVQLTATAASGFRFGSWRTGPCANSLEPTCAVPMDQSRIVRVLFVPESEPPPGTLFLDGFE